MAEYTFAIEAFREMYKNKQLEISKVKKMLNNKVITLEEYNYILGKTEG